MVFALGREDDACEVHLGEALSGPPSDKGGRHFVAVYCATKGDCRGEAGPSAARDGGAMSFLAAAGIGRVSKTSTRQPSLPASVGVIDHLFLSLGERDRDSRAKAEPELSFSPMIGGSG
jgi:hypothetical protein